MSIGSVIGSRDGRYRPNDYAPAVDAVGADLSGPLESPWTAWLERELVY